MIKTIIVTVLTFFLVMHIAAYLINPKEHAKVMLNDCHEPQKTKCTIYEGKLKRTFWRQDYIVIVDGKEIYIPKAQVASTMWSSKAK